MSKQTAVEWLVDELLSGKPLMPSLIEQAKEMEKEQIEDAFNEGVDWHRVCKNLNEMLDMQRDNDFFGTEGELDPRGDNRN